MPTIIPPGSNADPSNGPQDLPLRDDVDIGKPIENNNEGGPSQKSIQGLLSIPGVTSESSPEGIAEALDALPASRPDNSARLAAGVRPGPMTELQWVGAKLAKLVICLIAVIIAALLILMAINEFWRPMPEADAMQRLAEYATKEALSASSPESLSRATEVFTRLNEARRSSRDFWMSVGQFLLTGLLLPVLTSILGYIFGTMSAEKKNSSE